MHTHPDSIPKTERDEMKRSSPGLLVLGMHRSGTSCLAGMLESAGFYTGEVDQWNPHNLKGNRENLAAMAINDTLLRASGGSWDQVPEVQRIASHHQADIRRLTNALSAAGRPWLVKDPRTLLVLNSWTETLADLNMYGIFRHPISVAESLRIRDDSPLQAGVSLWCAYNERLLAALDVHSFPLVLFNGEAAHIKKAVSSGLSALFPELVNAQILNIEKAGAFVDGSLVHHAGVIEKNIRARLHELAIPSELADRTQHIWASLLDRQNPTRLELPAHGVSAKTLTTNATALVIKTATEQSMDGVQSIRTIDAQIKEADDRTDLFRRGTAVLEKAQGRTGPIPWLRGWCERLPDEPLVHWELAYRLWADNNRDEAIEHAVQAHRLAPGWLTPSLALAEWAMEAERWQLAAEINRGLYNMQFSHAKDLAPVAELFVDSGDGFNPDESAAQPISTAFSSVALCFDNTDLLMGMHQFRLDPLNQAAVIQDVRLTLRRQDGVVISMEPSGSNAELESEGVFYFVTDDPQIFFSEPVATDSPVVALNAQYRIAWVGDDASRECIRRLKGMLRSADEISDAVRNEIKSSVSWRITAPLRWLYERLS